MSRLGRVDLNLLVYLDALLRERNVTQAAHSLGPVSYTHLTLPTILRV